MPRHTCPVFSGTARTRSRSVRPTPMSSRRAISTPARPRSTAAATRSRRASSARWCWGCDPRRLDQGPKGRVERPSLHNMPLIVERRSLRSGLRPSVETTEALMDLALKPEHQAFADEVRAFAHANLSPATREKTFSGKHYDRDDHMAWQQALGRQGWLAYTLPKKYGGPGWDVTQRFLFENVLAEEGAPRIIPFGPKMVRPVIYTFGSDEQKERFLPGIRQSTVSWCQGYSEPGAGSDLANLRTRAVRDGDHYIVNGQKTWTSFAHWGDWIFCLVRTSPDAKPQEGITFLLIDMKTPGVTVR